MLVSVSPADSWFYRVGVLDVATGRFTPLKVTPIQVTRYPVIGQRMDA
jgi:hypothetical protein